MRTTAKQRKWGPLSVLGLLVMVLFAVICITPFIYMILMSFTQSTTTALYLKDVVLTDFSNFQQVLSKNGFFLPF